MTIVEMDFVLISNYGICSEIKLLTRTFKFCNFSFEMFPSSLIIDEYFPFLT